MNACPCVNGQIDSGRVVDGTFPDPYPLSSSEGQRIFLCEMTDGRTSYSFQFIVARIVPTPTPTPRVVLFLTSWRRQGNFGARAGGDAWCALSANKPADLTNIKAVFSASPTDQMRDVLPIAFRGIQVERPDGTVIDTDWNALFDGPGPAVAVVVLFGGNNCPMSKRRNVQLGYIAFWT